MWLLDQVVNPMFVEECFDQFKNTLLETGMFKAVGTIPRRDVPYTLYRSERYSFRFYTRKTTTRTHNVYWNAFGLQIESPNKLPNPDVEINFAFDGSHDKDAGVFLKDSERNVFIGHRGDIKDGKNKFWTHFHGERTFIDGKEIALVAKIDDNLAANIDEVVRIKSM